MNKPSKSKAEEGEGYSYSDEIEKAHFLEDGNTDDIEGTSDPQSGEVE